VKENNDPIEMAQGICKTYYNFAIELWIYGLSLFWNVLLKFANIFVDIVKNLFRKIGQN
jgi:hypothetical protein